MCATAIRHRSPPRCSFHSAPLPAQSPAKQPIFNRRRGRCLRKSTHASVEQNGGGGGRSLQHSANDDEVVDCVSFVFITLEFIFVCPVHASGEMVARLTDFGVRPRRQRRQRRREIMSSVRRCQKGKQDLLLSPTGAARALLMCVCVFFGGQWSNSHTRLSESKRSKTGVKSCRYILTRGTRGGATRYLDCIASHASLTNWLITSIVVAGVGHHFRAVAGFTQKHHHHTTLPLCHDCVASDGPSLLPFVQPNEQIPNTRTHTQPE